MSYFYEQSVNTVMQKTMQPSLPCAFREDDVVAAAAASAVMYYFPQSLKDLL